MYEPCFSFNLFNSGLLASRTSILTMATTLGTFHDSPVSRLANWLSSSRSSTYPDHELASLPSLNGGQGGEERHSFQDLGESQESRPKPNPQASTIHSPASAGFINNDRNITTSTKIRTNNSTHKINSDTDNAIVVRWCHNQDPEHPRNWTAKKKCFIVFVIW